jgi:hypothetical protein
MVASAAAIRPMTRLILKKEVTNDWLVKNAANQRRVKPLGGNSKATLGPNDTAITTMSGAKSPI